MEEVSLAGVQMDSWCVCRHKITVKKGDSIGQFLKGVREMLAPKYRELRHGSVSNMMYVKVRQPCLPQLCGSIGSC